MSGIPDEKTSKISISIASQLIEKDVKGYKPYKIFINNVDSFHSRYCSKYISSQLYGALKLGGQGPDEGGDEEMLNEDAPNALPTALPTDNYEFIGSLAHKSVKITEDFLYTINENEPSFDEEIINCGVIIYDITSKVEEIPKALKTLSILTNQLEELKNIGDKTYEYFDEPKTFVLISPVMTWALTKPLDPDEPELPFSEVDYRKRRPHPNYRSHFDCERDVMKIGKQYPDKLRTYVLCSGITYGHEESDLEFFFKMAWYNEVIPIFNNGSNIVPIIHVNDLAKALHGLIENIPRKPQYILAVEQTPSSLKKIMVSLSKSMSSGKVSNVVAEEAFLYTNMTQTLFERCTVNVNMEPVFLVENLQIPWQSEAPLPENMNQIVKEFKTCHKLTPTKIVLHGPPGSGKTQLAKKLCEHYKCHYVSTATMIEELMEEWKENLANAQKPKPAPPPEEMLGEEELEEIEEEDEDDPQTIIERIREIQVLMDNGIENFPHDILIGLAKMFLQKNLCQNRGYVFDDYPKTIEQAKELFGPGSGGGGEEEEEEGGSKPDAGKILPDLVISFLATDEYICKHAMDLTEDQIRDTRFSEENLPRRLEEFRANNTEDNTVLNFFDEIEVDIMLREINETETIEKLFHEICAKCGPPVGFGLSDKELEELFRIEEEERRLQLELEEINKKHELERAEQERKEKMELWAETLTKLQMEEEKILIAQSEPLRHYLMKFVFPILTKGLIELAKIKPEDPVDFLAEYLFKQNPESRMFDPSYTQAGEDLENEYAANVKEILEHSEEYIN